MRNLARLILTAILLLSLLLAAGTARAEVYYKKEPPADWAEKDIFKLTVFDVNEGDAMLLECGGEIMMIDGGPDPHREKLKTALEERGYTHFKYFLSTHFHDDHINGLYHLMTYGFTADEFLHSYNDRAAVTNELHGRAIRQCEKSGIPTRKIDEGDVLTLGGATMNVHRHADVDNANGRSLVLKLTFGESTVLFCADIIGVTQEYYTATLSPEELKADLLKVPHHGITAVNSDFLTAVDPAMAVVPNTAKNGAKAKRQLDRREIPTLYSGDGTVYFATDGTDWYMWQTKGKF
ncbi:MAG: MBL fold metallo-hydrolase [Clostridia bacterium]|nr:MBL fold metallo-hydrolase [Clostridia bacterium]